jgi:hypothetical protein
LKKPLCKSLIWDLHRGFVIWAYKHLSFHFILQTLTSKTTFLLHSDSFKFIQIRSNFQSLNSIQKLALKFKKYQHQIEKSYKLLHEFYTYHQQNEKSYKLLHEFSTYHQQNQTNLKRPQRRHKRKRSATAPGTYYLWTRALDRIRTRDWLFLLKLVKYILTWDFSLSHQLKTF